MLAGTAAGRARLGPRPRGLAIAASLPQLCAYGADVCFLAGRGELAAKWVC